MSDSGDTESKVGKVLLIGVTGGTGGNEISPEINYALPKIFVETFHRNVSTPFLEMSIR